jgi:hypothetical protein
VLRLPCWRNAVCTCAEAIPYDHTSVIATLRKRFPELGHPLTERDAVARLRSRSQYWIDLGGDFYRKTQRWRGLHESSRRHLCAGSQGRSPGPVPSATASRLACRSYVHTHRRHCEFARSNGLSTSSLSCKKTGKRENHVGLGFIWRIPAGYSDSSRPTYSAMKSYRREA